MNLNLKLRLSTLFFLASGSSMAAPIDNSEDNNQSSINIPKIMQAAKIDGELNEPSWSNAKKILVNNITWPDENVSAPVKTEALVYENGETLFIAFKAYDPKPGEIRAYLTDRDKNWNDDRVSVKIDSYHDHALAYQFYVNPLGTQADSIENELTKQESPAWDGIWESAGKITSEGYEVEIAIPLRILNFNEGLDIQKWGMEFIRFYPRDSQYRISNTIISQDNPCWICQMPVATGFKGAKQGNNLTIVPTLVSGTTKTRDLPDDFNWEKESNSDAGVDLKWGITPDLTLNATFNPDFSQVEADSGQLDVNNTFALYLQEKRSFFLENQDYFATPVNLIYTRNINDPDYGGKLTGKMGDHSIAAFFANDQSANFLLPGNLGSGSYEIEEKTTNAAVRYRYGVNDELAVGALTTIRENDSYHNYVASTDVKYQPSPNDTINVQFISSDTELSKDVLDDIQDDNNEQSVRAQTVNGIDRAFRVNYRHENRDWFFNLNHMNIGKDFRADLAFFNNSDFIKNVIGGGYIWRGDKEDWWTRIRIDGDWDITTNQDGEQIEQESQIYFNLNGPLQGFYRVGWEQREKVANRENDDILDIEGNTTTFDEKEFRSWFELKPTSSLWYGNFFKTGKNIDYTNNRLSDVLVWEPNISWNLNTNFKTRLSYTYSKMEFEDKPVYTANLVDLRMTYQFSIKSFLRLSMVHYDIERNIGNYLPEHQQDTDEQEKYLSAQLLYSYKINPQTLFFLGYAHGAQQTDALSKMTDDTRSVFLKLSYAWLL